MKIIYLFLFVSLGLCAEYSSSISKITPEIKKRMIHGNSWREGCPVSLENLRYLRLTHKNFKGTDVKGELIVHKNVTSEVAQIFEELYSISYPINKMKLVSDYKGNDWQSIEADNTSAFNCRNATGSKKWSKHSYGKAIDINPIENPYVFKSGRSSHKASAKYIIRKENHPAVILKTSKVLQIFKKHGWSWGGDWYGAKDYQHFYK